MKQLNYLLLLFLLPFYSIAQVPVSGRVTDENNQPLLGVSITIKGKTGGGTTSVQGTFAITVPDTKSTLIFSSV